MFECFSRVKVGYWILDPVEVVVGEQSGVAFNKLRYLGRVIDAGNIGWDGSLNSAEQWNLQNLTFCKHAKTTEHKTTQFCWVTGIILL